jgi:hypothetical protein
METEFTEGPWVFNEEYVRDDKGRPVADPYCRATKDTYEGEMEANAALMAASPDLYAACDELMSAVSSAIDLLDMHEDDIPNHWKAALQMGDAALSKSLYGERATDGN